MIDITPEWLTRHLTKNNHLHDGEVTEVVIESTHKHHRVLAVQYSANAVTTALERMLIKVYNAEYSWGAREGIFYADVGPATPNAPLPACYAVDLHDRSGKTYILLEDLSATHYVTPSSTEANVDLDTWKQVLDFISGVPHILVGTSENQ